MENNIAEKSFVPKLFSQEQPDHSWDLERLGTFIREKYSAILASEKSLTPLYWFLGMALEIARKQIGRGPWGMMLTEWGVSKAKACRARSIFRTFSSVDAVAGLSVEEAFDRRVRRQVHASRKRTNTKANGQTEDRSVGQGAREADVDDLEAFLEATRSRADELLDLVAFADQERLVALRPLYEAAVARLQDLGRMLESSRQSLDTPKTPRRRSRPRSHFAEDPERLV